MVLEETKNRLKVVHPFRFMAFVLTDHCIRVTLEELYKTDFKWSFLVVGIERAFRRKKEAEALDEYVSGFADFLGVDESVIQGYIDRGNFKGMLNYLMELNI